MDDTRDRIEDWDSRPVEDRTALRRLADDGFTGAVVDGSAILFLLNGRAVGSVGRAVEDFDGGTAHEAPDASLPLLFAMQAKGGETRTRGYTNETPLSEVDGTLQSSNFTGYVELAENVLSGDYYMVYYGGRPLYAAFVGPESERLTGDEAFERAVDEVGIYEVTDVDLDVADLPAPEASDSEAADESVGRAAASGAGGGGATEATETAETEPIAEAEQTDEPDEGDEPNRPAPTVEEATETEAGDTEAETPAEADASAETDEPVEPETEPQGRSEPEPVAEAESEGQTAAEPSADAGEGGEGTESVQSPAEPGDEPGSDDAARAPSKEDDDAGTMDAPNGRGANGVAGDAEAAEEEEAVFAEEEEWRNTTSIPALSPDEEPDESESASGRRMRSSDGESRHSESGSDSGYATGTVSRLEAELEDRTEKLESARERIDSLTADLESEREARERLEAELEDLRSERDDLRERVETLEEDLAEARASAATGGRGGAEQPADGPSLDPERALGETNLFVRYESRGQPTLEDVDDSADPDAVTANLHLGDHTQFDATDATVEGVPFEEFLYATPEYQFVRWAVTELPFEIRETGHESGLAELYAAIPDVDRAELHGAVEVETDEEGTTREYEFDVVLRDRMGDVLLVADINARRDPVTGEMMSDLVDAATAVETGSESDVGGALYVTESFFAPDALETAEEAAGGGFLSRSSKESYVRTGRKQGFHLCLVESRDDSFYVTVPEL